jgi:hypothetical protein
LTRLAMRFVDLSKFMEGGALHRHVECQHA